MHCRVLRVKPEDGKIRQIDVPWGGDRSNGFTLLFEALLMQLCSEMPVNAVSRLTNADDNKIWRMLECYVDAARAHEDFSGMTQIGPDETSKRKNHDYVTVFVDMERRKTVFVTEGKDNTTLERFVVDIENHVGKKENITDASCDMSLAFIKGIGENLKNAKITFDKFHLRESFQGIYKSETRDVFISCLEKWGIHCRLEPMKEAAKTIKRHWDGVTRWLIQG